MILVYLLAAALLIGYARGGSLKGYARSPLRLEYLPILAFLIEAFINPLIGALPLDREAALALLVSAQYACLFAFCFVNRERPAIRWIFWGALLNLLVISHNGFRMPVSPVAREIESLKRTVARIDSGELIEYAVKDVSAPLFALGDVIYLPFVPDGLASFGDFLIGIGVFRLISDWMKPFKRRVPFGR